MSAEQFAQSRCQFGISHGDMTPPVGIYHRMWGAARHDRATGIHRPLRATVLAFGPLTDNSSQEIQILIALDHCILGSREQSIIEQAITTTTRIRSEQIVVVCSHTHAAGLLSLDRVDLPGGELIPDYLNSLANTTAKLVAEAIQSPRPVTMIHGVGSCRLAANRDYWDEKTQQFVCGYNPLEPADDTAVVVRVDADDGKIIATIVNYACHPTTLAWDNTLISPDFPGEMRELIESATSAPCVFLQGASGELGPREGFLGDVDVADRNGRQLGYAALSILNSLPAANQRYEYTGPIVSGATIGTWAYRSLTSDERKQLGVWSNWQGTIDLPYRCDLVPVEQITADLSQHEQEAAAAFSRGDNASAMRHRALAERRRRELARRRALPEGETYPYQAAVWRMGEAIWVCVQGEPYSMLQTELRRRFKDVLLVVCSLGFSWGVAYLPPAEKYGLGLYQEGIAVVAPGGLEIAIDAIARRIEKLLQVPSS
jgi:hypothetical protein